MFCVGVVINFSPMAIRLERYFMWQDRLKKNGPSGVRCADSRSIAKWVIRWR